MRKIIISFAALLSLSLQLRAQSSVLGQSLRGHIEYLSSDVLQGRKAGTQGEESAAAYLYDKLKEAGLTMLTGREGDTFLIAGEKDTLASRNIVAVLEGSDPLLRNEYIVIGAHIDHLGSNILNVNGKDVLQIYPGADNNASGVAALIEVAAMASQSSLMFRRSVIFVGFGAGESAMAGAWYFANKGFSSIGDVKAMIDLNMLGRGNSSNPFMVYTVISRNDLNSVMGYVREHESVTTQPVVADGNIIPSSHLVFYERGIPSILFSTGISKECRTLKDAPDLILYDNLAAECIYINSFLRSIAYKDIIIPSKSVSSDTEQEVVYSASDCDKRPQFFHSDEKHFLDTWVYKYLKYPEDAISKGIQGKVIVSFIVDKSGKVTNTTIEKGVYESLDDEALKVVSISPKWIPGEIGKRKVRTKIVIPVEFRLKRK